MFKLCCRSLYEVNDVSVTLEQLSECLSVFQASPRNVANAEPDDVEDFAIGPVRERLSSETLNSISENITNFSLDRVKNDAFMVRRDTDQEIWMTAENIVGRVINEAKRVIKEEANGDSGYIQGLGAVYMGSNVRSQVEMESEQNANQLSANIEHDIVIESVEADDCCGGGDVEDSRSRSNGWGDRRPEYLVQLKTTKEHGESESLEGMLDKLYGIYLKVEPCNDLGEDLLRLLLMQVDCDCVIQVDGGSLHAHR